MNNNAKIIEQQIIDSEKNLANSMNQIGNEMVEDFKHNLSRQGIRMRSGELEKSIKVSVIDGNSVTVVNDIDYASYVNDGTSKMKARPYMIDSKELDKKIDNIIDNSIIKATK